MAVEHIARLVDVVIHAPDTRSLLLEPAERLRFKPGQFVSCLVPSGGETLVEIDEDAVSGPGTFVPRLARGLSIKVRNVEALRRLALLAEGRSAR